MGFPMGAVMFLETGGEVNYKPRVFTGVESSKSSVKPYYLVLDGQQRLTTLFQVFMSNKPVEICTEKNKKATIYRYYYLDIKKALDDDEDREDAIISIPSEKLKKADIGKTILLHLSTREKEYENLMFPLNLVFSLEGVTNWLLGLVAFYQGDAAKVALYQEFNAKIIAPITSYKLPVIKVLLAESHQASTSRRCLTVRFPRKNWNIR